MCFSKNQYYRMDLLGLDDLYRLILRILEFDWIGEQESLKLPPSDQMKNYIENILEVVTRQNNEMDNDTQIEDQNHFSSIIGLGTFHNLQFYQPKNTIIQTRANIMKGEMSIGLKKSQTAGFALPTISKMSGNLSKQYHHTERTMRNAQRKSMFIERVKDQIPQEMRYECMETPKITEEQQKLKKLLRSFNEETYNIMSNYIGNPRARETSSLLGQRKERSASEVIQLRDKEIQNKQKIIQQCLNEIQMMEMRCQNLKYMSYEEMEKQIGTVQQEIQELRVGNRQMVKGVTVSGLNICRGERFNLVKQAQYDRLMLEGKKTQLIQNSEEVEKQNEVVKLKNIKIDQDLLKLQAEFKTALNSQSQCTAQSSIKQTLKEKRKHFDILKHKNQQLNNSLKHKYLQKLKELDETGGKIKKYQGASSVIEQNLDKTKKQLILYEHKMSALKNGVTIKLLDQSNHHKKEEINSSK